MSSPFPLSDFVMVMQSAVKYLYQIGCPILMFAGTVSCLINLIVFSQKLLRKNPCSMYFIAYNIANFFYIYSSLLSLLFDVGFNIDPSSSNLVICRLRLYTVLLFNNLGSFYLVMASFDRFFITSRNANTRRYSSQRTAYICIISGTLFGVLFHTHALIFTNIIELVPYYFQCFFQPGIYLTFIGYYSFIEQTLALALIIMCGLWSVKSTRSLRRIAVVPTQTALKTIVGVNTNASWTKDQQLLLMLLMDILVYATFSLSTAIFFLYQQVTQNYIKTLDLIQMENHIRNICLFSFAIPCCISCYTNLLVSKAFRKEVKKIFLCR